ncbi:MAG: hypothetical protein ACRDRG_14545 [Pseudonocardiaceae bacterium]
MCSSSWALTSAWMTVSIGVATSGARLALVTRYRVEQFDADADAAAEFTDLLIAQVLRC